LRCLLRSEFQEMFFSEDEETRIGTPTKALPWQRVAIFERQQRNVWQGFDDNRQLVEGMKFVIVATRIGP
jgi:hypothetical protein